MVQKLIITGLMLLFMLRPEQAPAVALSVGDTIPDFKIKTVEGRMVDSGKIVEKKPMFLIFWATWCPNCKKELPLLKKIAADYGARGMFFLGINPGVNDSVRRVERYVKRYGVNYPIAFDHGSKVTKTFKVQGVPTIVITDRQGVIQYIDHAVPRDLEKHFNDLMH